MITVIITTWQVPFDQVVHGTYQFSTDAAALRFINETSAQWWNAHDGDRSVREGHTEQPYEPIAELGYNVARYELWGGESGFHAMLDEGSYARLHEAHYAREYDAKGEERPGYLINAYVAGAKPGGTTTDEQAKYETAQRKGFAAIRKAFGWPEPH
jgi:hypothetical protein